MSGTRGAKARTKAVQAEPAEPQALFKAPERVRLATVANVLTELKRIYKLGLSGKLPWVEARSAALILRQIRDVLELSALEGQMGELIARLRALEDAENVKGPRPTPPNPYRNNGRKRRDGLQSRPGRTYQ